MSRADTWMPLYIADYAKDTLHLTTEQHGAYFLLIMACWTRGGVLPADDGQLAGIARMPPSAWRKIAPVVMALFKPNGDDGWFHKRVREEHAKAARLSAARKESGGKGGRPRKQTESSEEPIGFLEDNLGETPAQVAPPLPPPPEVRSVAIAPDLAPSASKPAKRKAPARPIPEGWTPTEAGCRFAIERGMPPEAIEGQAERFRDHHAAKGATFADIDAAWRTWAGNFNTFKPRVINGSRPQSSGVDKLVAVGGAMRAAFRDG